MPMIRCDGGHFYENSKFSACPYCRKVDVDVPTTKGANPPAGGGGKTPNDGPGPTRTSDKGTRDSGQTVSRGHSSEGETVGVYRKNYGYEPVVGWLVCVDGPSRGQDYRIKTENNTIGRDPSNRIHISGDDTISRQKAAVICYDPQSNTYWMEKGDGTSLCYVNSKPIRQSVDLSRGDVITLGKTVLIFVPLCDENFKWAEEGMA